MRPSDKMPSNSSAQSGPYLSSELSVKATISPSQPSIHVNANPSSFSLMMLFQITTASALFFACLRYSPLAAIVLTILFAPAVIRTGQISDIHKQNIMEFGLAKRIRCFFGSIAVVILTVAFAVLVFVLVSLTFGLLGMVFSTAVGSADLSIDAAIVGTAGGMIWGFAGAMLATGFAVIRMWLPKELVKTEPA